MMVRPTLVRFLAVSVVALILAACRDTSGPLEHRTIVPRDRSATISDGAHHNGNDDVFFLPPMVANPQGVPGYGDPFQPGLPVAFVIRDQTAGGAVLRTLAGTVQDESYQANWDTKADNLIASHVYRIEVAIAQKVVAFADVIVGANGSALKNVNTNDNIALIDGRTLPVKVRVEKGWNCVNNAACTTQVVSNSVPTGQTVIVKSPDGNNMAAFSGDWFDPQQAGTSNVVVTIEDVSSQYTPQPGGCSLGLTNENGRGLFGLSAEYCVRISVEPHVILTQPVVVATCRTNPGDERQLLMKFDVNETPKFLNESAPPSPCPVNIGSTVRDKNPLKRFAAAIFSGAGSAINWALGVKPAYAIHLGVGGIVDIGDDFSIFTLGLPAEMVALPWTPPLGVAGAALPVKPRVRVVAVHDVSPTTDGVTNAGVTCQVTSGTGGGFVVNNQIVPSAPATELPSNDGTYECPTWVLAQAVGANTLKVTSARLDASIIANLDGNIVTLPGSVTFSASGAAVASVGVSPASTPLTVGQTQQLTANVSQTGGAPTTVVWASNSPAIATVDVNGLVTAVSPGSTTISATSTFDGTKSGSATITVSVAPAITSVIVSPNTLNLNVGIGSPLSVQVNAVGGAPTTVQWSSSNTNIATVSGSGLVTAVSPGHAKITAVSTFDATKKDTSGVTVNAQAPAVLSVSLSPIGVVIPINNQGVQFTPTVTVVNGAPQTVTWFLSNGAAASVSASGLVTPTNVGSAILTATSTFDQTKSATSSIDVINVQPDFYDIQLQSTTATIGGSAIQYLARVSNGTGSTFPGTVFIQAFIDQGNASRAANGTDVTCGPTGVLPFGICNTSFDYGASNTASGNGTLVPGTATLRFELRQFLNSTETLLATKTFTIILQ